MKLLYDWFIALPARIIDYLLLVAFGFVMLIPPNVAWYCTVSLVESKKLNWRDWTTRPSRVTSWIAAIVVTTYVTLVCLAAVHELPRVFYWVAGPEN